MVAFLSPGLMTRCLGSRRLIEREHSLIIISKKA
jgi:hypothetical protein